MAEKKSLTTNSSALTAEEEKELITNFDLLMNYDVLEAEADWDVVQDLDSDELTEVQNEEK
jgi:hypothetical protein